MLEYSYFLIILLLRLPQNIFNKRSSGIVRGAPAYFAYGAYRYLLSGGMALVLLLFAGGFSGVSLKALAISAIGAVALGSNLFFGLEALKSGAMVLSSMAGSAGLLLPCVFGIFMFDEPMSLMQLFGILLLIFSGWLLIGYSKKLKGSFTPRTMLLLIGSMLSNGFTMVAQKMFSKYLPDVSVSVFSVLSLDHTAHNQPARDNRRQSHPIRDNVPDKRRRSYNNHRADRRCCIQGKAYGEKRRGAGARNSVAYRDKPVLKSDIILFPAAI